MATMFLATISQKTSNSSRYILQNLPKSSKISQMQPEARQKRIQEYLNRVEFASLEELAKEVEASVSSVRRDVAALEAAGGLRRMHGGARLITPHSDEFAFTAR